MALAELSRDERHAGTRGRDGARSSRPPRWPGRAHRPAHPREPTRAIAGALRTMTVAVLVALAAAAALTPRWQRVARGDAVSDPHRARAVARAGEAAWRAIAAALSMERARASHDAVARLPRSTAACRLVGGARRAARPRSRQSLGDPDAGAGLPAGQQPSSGSTAQPCRASGESRGARAHPAGGRGTRARRGRPSRRPARRPGARRRVGRGGRARARARGLHAEWGRG